MKSEAIGQARQRLERCKSALTSLKNENWKFSDFNAAWSNFINAANGVYSKLEQGSKGDAKSEAWFAEKKQHRNDDPLLRYLH